MSVVRHDFVTTTFTKPTNCQFCKGFIWGAVKQGKQCKGCKYPIHHKCVSSVSNEPCTPNLALSSSLSSFSSSFSSSSSSAPMEDPTGEWLEVHVLAGRNLVAKDSNGLSDPFCKFFLYGAHGLKLTKTFKTQIKNGTLNPVWGDIFKIPIPNEKCLGIALSVLDHDLLASDDPMGGILIELDSLPYNQAIQHWFVLNPTANCPDAHGEIDLRLHYHTSKTAPVGRPWKQEKAIDQTARLLIENRIKLLCPPTSKSGGRINVKMTYSPPVGTWHGCLTVNVSDAKDLLPKDSNGKSDPYAIVKVGTIVSKTRTRYSTLHPFWGDTFYINIPNNYGDELVIFEVWDWNRAQADEMIAIAVFPLMDLSSTNEFCGEIELKAIPSEAQYSSRPGQEAKLKGCEPNLPVVLIPGFASTSLRVEQSPYPSWVSERVWLSLAKIGTAKYNNITSAASQMGKQLLEGIDAIFGGANKASTAAKAESNDSAEDTTFKNKWLDHVCLADDAMSDPPGIKVRAVPGAEGVMYLDDGAAITRELSWVMAPVVNALQDLGYSFDQNLLAAPYDWRLPPFALESRDGFFSNLKKSIEKLVEKNKGTPAVLFAHSMGNRTAHYFLNWISLQPEGAKWIDKHVHTFIAVGSPWLGAPKMIRCLATGERMGMEALIDLSEAIRFSRSLGATPSLLPLGDDEYFEYPKQASFVYIKEKNGSLTPVEMLDFLKQVGATSQLELIERYNKDPCFGGPKGQEAILKPPPVKRLYSMYGTNLPTEKVYCYRKTTTGAWELTEGDPKIPGINFPAADFSGIVKVGIGYETPRTLQRNIKACKSGDGTVTYESLNYCVFWSNEIQNLMVDEFPEAEHREILNNRAFLGKLVDYVSKRGDVEGWQTKCDESSYNSAMSVASELLAEADQ